MSYAEVPSGLQPVKVQLKLSSNFPSTEKYLRTREESKDMENVIGIDVGTSSVKALLVSSNGEVLKVSSPEYPFQTPKALWAETDPEVWWTATQKAIHNLLEVDPKSIKVVGLTGQMHTVWFYWMRRDRFCDPVSCGMIKGPMRSVKR